MSEHFRDYLLSLPLTEEQEQKLIDYAKLLLAQEQAVANNTIYAYPKKAHYTFDDLQEIATQYSVDKKWTYNQLLDAFPETAQKIEIINAELFIMPAPSRHHQKISRILSSLLISFVDKHNLGEVYYAPLDVVLNSQNVVQPDILFVSNERSEILTDKGIKGSPDLVIEILSPANYKAERERKKTVYEKFGVKEYWEINPQKQSVEITILKQNRYKIFNSAEKEGVVKSLILEGFTLEINDIFELS